MLGAQLKHLTWPHCSTFMMLFMLALWISSSSIVDLIQQQSCRTHECAVGSDPTGARALSKTFP
eukprot:455061-Amphidinium_carterae.1